MSEGAARLRPKITDSRDDKPVHLCFTHQMTKHSPSSPTSAALSQRESDVLALVALGRRNKQIAIELEITENTVETHLKGIFKKLKVHTRVEAMLVRARQIR